MTATERTALLFKSKYETACVPVARDKTPLVIRKTCIRPECGGRLRAPLRQGKFLRERQHRQGFGQRRVGPRTRRASHAHPARRRKLHARNAPQEFPAKATRRRLLERRRLGGKREHRRGGKHTRTGFRALFKAALQGHCKRFAADIAVPKRNGCRQKQQAENSLDFGCFRTYGIYALAAAERLQRGILQ